MKKVALITGVTGQDGSYLAELLLKKGYEVHGIKRRASSFNTDRIDHLYQDPHVSARNFTLHYGDLTDSSNLIRIIQQVQPDEIYNLGAMSHVAVSFESPEYTADADGMGTLRILEAIRILGLDPGLGEVDGAFCDGRYNVTLEQRKLVGTAQRWRRRPSDGRHICLAHAAVLLENQRQSMVEVVNSFYAGCNLPSRCRVASHMALDELLEAMTLIQTKKSRKIPIILVHRPFWQGLLDWLRDRLVAEGMIHRDDLDLVQVIDKPEDVVEAIFKHYERRGFQPLPAEREMMLNL